MEKIFDPQEAHKYCTDNRSSFEAEQKCGCFYCGKTFPSSEIKDWISEGKIGTALCPYCGIDAVIGEFSGYDITDDLLRKMHLYWFESGVGKSVHTTFDNIYLNIDGKSRTFRFSAILPEQPFADVNGIYKIEYDFEADGKEHEIKLLLDNPECNAYSESGERFDTISADLGDGRITLAFIEPEVFDFKIEFMKNGIILRSDKNTASQTLKFGVCWIDKLLSADDIQTWLGADVK